MSISLGRDCVYKLVTDWSSEGQGQQGSYRHWKVLERGIGPGKPWKSPGTLK